MDQMLEILRLVSSFLIVTSILIYRMKVVLPIKNFSKRLENFYWLMKVSIQLKKIKSMKNYVKSMVKPSERWQSQKDMI